MSRRRLGHQAWVHLVACTGLGLAAAAGVSAAGQPTLAPLSGWIAGASGWCLWSWLVVRRMDGRQTERHSQAEDPSRGAADLLLLLAVAASLGGVGQLLVAGTAKDASGDVMGGVGLAAVASSWFLVHMLFTLRYAKLYYGEGNRGVEIGDEEQPDYQDFAYLSYCLGMTYQVSDQTIKDRTIRRTVMRHTLLSYGLGVVVTGCTINLVVQLASS